VELAECVFEFVDGDFMPAATTVPRWTTGDNDSDNLNHASCP